MDARFYNSEEIDIERLAIDLVNVYIAQGYQAQQLGNKDQMLVQLKKGGDFEAIIGMQAALSLTIQRTTGGVLAMIGQQRWIDKAAIGAVGIVALPVLWPLAITAGVGALRQASLGNQLLNVVDGLVRQQRPGIQAGPIPYQIMPQIQQQWAPPPYSPTPAYIPPPQVVVSQLPPVPRELPAPAPVVSSPPAAEKLRCSNCNTPYEPGDTFCSGCGRSLTPPRLYCSNCNSEIKPGTSFCPKCGASTFQTFSAAAQQTMPKPQMPPVQPTPTVTYTQPTQQTPAYTPPAQQRPETPYYTPPAQQTPAQQRSETPYYTPSAQQTPAAEPYSAPTVASQPAAPSQPTEPYYVPPVTQEPPVVPQPKVTIVPSAPKEQPAPPQPKRQPKQYYIPSNQAQQAAQATPQAQTPAQQPAPSKTIQAKPVSQPASSPNTPWGTLAFSDGEQVQLTGERAMVGRYDHDLDGIQPEVDLSKQQGADTVSRIHAVLEHIGSAYTLTDLNSTNATRINGKRLVADQATPVNDGDSLQFGKVTCTFKKL
ncbi:MAG: FHA domain-containing protein [Chloroflexi bacterium]|nr:FHA domain-containing protein [Chloroflexota bacterium]